MRAMRIAIVGSGGVGGYFGGRLAATGVDVTFIARGAHLAAMRERGLRIESPAGNLHVPRVSATDDPASVGPVDIVFFTVKLYDTAGIRETPELIECDLHNVLQGVVHELAAPLPGSVGSPDARPQDLQLELTVLSQCAIREVVGSAGKEP
jgi:hypothetical protein